LTQDNEFYPTPEPLAAYLLERMLWQVPGSMFSQQDEGGVDVALQMIEPSAGKGAFAKALASLGHSVIAVEPHFEDPGIEGVDWEQSTLEDFLEILGEGSFFDIACGNPPFSLAESHLRLLLPKMNRGGHIGFLLRLGFLSSAKRRDFFNSYTPKHIYVLPRRPSFVWSWSCKNSGCGHKWVDEPGKKFKCCELCSSDKISVTKTDKYDYMFIIWEVGRDPGASTTITWLNNEGEDDA
jgi:hypothetical protein